MSEKPILFNTEMVQAILADRKTVTRRVLKKPFEVHENGYITKPRKNERLAPYESPYNKGDIMYVRETWTVEGVEEENGEYVAYIGYKSERNTQKGYRKRMKIQQADFKKYEDFMYFGGDHRPSIHMPKDAARIFLKVIDVRVERLHDITEEEALKEGCICGKGKVTGVEWNARDNFEYLWDSTIKKQDIDTYGWNANPFVWVIEFERIEKSNKVE